MPAYVVFTREETVDPVELATYFANVDATFDRHEMRLLADYGTHEILEGDGIEGAVILEFPDMEAARAWYLSPEYQSQAQYRFRGARYRGFIVAGA